MAFLVARYLVYGAVAKFVEQRPKVAAINTVISDGGWQIVGLLRLSPLLPFSLQNYLYGVTDVRFSHYVMATLVGTMPSKLLYVFVGAAGKAAAGGVNSRLQLMFISVGLIVTIGTAILVARRARTQLRKRGISAV
ncbi:MAG: VTT domain-containing protein [Gammaproteobacteria bacterium]